MEEQKHNEELEKLLAKKNSGGLDDFEREALEGFGMLSSDDEIRQLKTDTDQKINAQLFSEKKKIFAYWYAAAGLILVAGFTIYFLRNNDKVLPQATVAMEQSNEPAKSVPSDMSPPVANEKKPELDNLTRADEQSKSAELKRERKIETAETYGQKSEAAQDKDAKGGGEGSHLAAGNISFENETSGKKQAEREESSLGLTKDIPSKKAALEEQDQEEKVRDKAESFSRSKNDAADDLKKAPAAEPKVADELTAKKKSKEAQPRKNSGVKTAAPAESNAEAAKTESPKNALASDNRNLQQGANYRDTVNYTGASSGAAQGAGNGPSPAVTLSQEDVIYKQLRTRLQIAGLDRAFSGKVYVRADKKTEKVELLNAGNFNNVEKNKLIGILQSLGQFNLVGKTPVNNLYEFVIDYKP